MNHISIYGNQVVLPLVEKYFRAHKAYFITNPNIHSTTGTATVKEKEMTARFDYLLIFYLL